MADQGNSNNPLSNNKNGHSIKGNKHQVVPEDQNMDLNLIDKYLVRTETQTQT